MDFDRLIKKIDERLAAMKIREREACRRADVNAAAIQNIRKRHKPGADILHALEKALKFDASDMMGQPAEAEEETSKAGGRPTDREIWYHVIVTTEQWFLEDGLEADPEDKAAWLLKFHEIATAMNTPLKFDPRDYSNVIQLSRNL